MTRLPASISSPAATSPASPPPTMMTSASILVLPSSRARSRASARDLARLQAGRAGSGFFGFLYEAHNALCHRRCDADLLRQRQNCALQIIDLRDAASEQVLPHGGARMRIDR